MTSIRTTADIEIYCSTCGNDISNHAHERRVDQLYVEPCETCMGNKDSQIHELDKEIETCYNTIESLEEKIRQLEERLNSNT